MAEISILKLSELNKDNRIDSDFYKKEFIENDKLIEKKEYFFLGDKKVSKKITDGDHGNPIYTDKEQGIPYLKSRDISDNDINLKDIEKLDKEYSAKINQRCFTKNSDVLLTTVGTIGISYIIKDRGKNFVLSRDIAKIQTEKEVLIPEFLYLFLKTKLGNLQIERLATGSVQRGLYLGAIKKIKIPKIDIEKQKEFVPIVDKIFRLVNNSREYFQKADDELISFLGLTNISTNGDLINYKKISEFVNGLRIDSEYYQNKYQELKKLLSKFESEKLSIIANVTDGDHGSPIYLEKGITFLRALNVWRYFLDYKDVKYISKEYHLKELKRSILKKDDVILTKIGTIGVVAVIPDIEANTTASCGKIRIKKEYLKRLDPYFLACFLNNLPGRLLMEMDTTGSVQTGIILKTLRNLNIPLVDYNFQLRIRELVEKGIRDREEARELLLTSINKIEKLDN